MNVFLKPLRNTFNNRPRFALGEPMNELSQAVRVGWLDRDHPLGDRQRGVSLMLVIEQFKLAFEQLANQLPVGVLRRITQRHKLTVNDLVPGFHRLLCIVRINRIRSQESRACSITGAE